jgi:Tol biopolymer transport system component
MEEAVLNPVPSPDGNKIAYTKNNYQGIWIYNLQTKNSIQLTDEMAAGFAFKWSADSKSILTRVAKYENLKRYNAVKVFDINSKESKLLTDYKTMMPYLPQWADGDTKIFLPDKTTNEIFTTDKSRNMMNNSSLVAFEKNNRLIIKNLNNNSEQTFEPIKDARYISLATSPDNNKVVFKVVGGDMYVMNLDGTNLIDLGLGNAPHWSPDSKKIVFEISQDDGYNYTASDIFSINADGTEKVNLTRSDDKIEMNPCFTPDGKDIIFNVVDDGSIYLMNIE